MRTRPRGSGINVLPKGKFQDEIMRTRPRGSGTSSAVEGNAIIGNLTCQSITNMVQVHNNIEKKI